MDIKTLYDRKAELVKSARAMLDNAGDEGLSAEDQAKYDGIKAEIETVSKNIKNHEDQMKLEASLPPAGPVSRVTVVKDNAEDDPKGGFKSHVDFLKAVMRAATTGNEDNRLKRFRAAQGSDEQQVGSDPYGGYLVPAGVAPGVLTVKPEDDFIKGLVLPVPMDTSTVSVNARVDKNHSSSVSGGLRVYRVPETDDATASRMAFEQVTLQAHDLFGVTYATENVLRDSPTSFIALLSAGFSDEFASNAINERLNGTGAGQFQGILHAGCSCTIEVSKESGQTATTIVTENIDKMIARCWKYNKAIWMANHDTRPQLSALYRTIGTAGELVNYFEPGGGAGGQDMLAGRPLYFTEYCQTLGTSGDIVLAMWGEYLEGSYQEIEQAESPHVRFLANERCFRFYKRNDGKPWWTSALTPKNSSNTLSPFVKLATRA